MWEYNLAGELVAQIDRLGQRTDIGYDPNGRIAAVADPSGRTTNHTYNPNGELEARSFGDGTIISYSYDNMGRRVSMSDPTGITTYDYDPNGRPIEVAAPNGTLEYGYDQAGRRTELTYPDGTTVTYDYDAAGRLVGLTDPNTGDIDYTLDNDGRLLLTQLPNGQTRQFDHVNGQLVRHQDHSRITDLTYDDSGRIATLTGAQNHTYSYDQAGQLLQAVQDEGTYSYTYGPRGEITSITDPDRSRTFTHNANVEIDGIVDDQGRPGDVTYDAAGRMTEHVDPDGTITNYAYDARGLLAEVRVTEPAEAEPEIPYPEPVPGQPTTGTISPIFECWTQEPDGTYTAYWGYENRTTQNGQPVGRTIAHGAQNRLTPSSFQGTQPTRFGVPGVIPGRPGRTAFGATAPNAFVTRNWNGSNLVWNVAGRTATASNTPSKQCTSGPDVQESIQETRVYDGSERLVRIQPASTTSGPISLVWDRDAAVPQIVGIDVGAGLQAILSGYDREALGGQIEVRTVLGDAYLGGQVNGPFGPATSPVEVRFGYRGELQTLSSVHLRARDVDASAAVFRTPDPLDGVAGTPTFGSTFHYANNDPINLRDPLGLRPTDWETFTPPAASPGLGQPESVPPICWGMHGDISDASTDEMVDFIEDYGNWSSSRSRAIGSCVADGLTDFFEFSVSFVPFGDCATALNDLFGTDQVSKLEVAGCALDVAGGTVAGIIVKGANGGQLLRRVDQIPSRRAQDIAVSPVAPSRLPTSGRSIGRASHDQALRTDLSNLPASARDVRVNQQQVNAAGQRVGVNRPDLQYTLNGQRYYVEYEGVPPVRGAEHTARITANDPTAIVIVREVP